LKMTGDSIIFNLNSTRPIENATVRLKTKDRTLFEEKIFVSPAQPKQFRIPVPFSINEQDLTAEVIKNDTTLLSYTPKSRPGEPRPQPVEPPRAPETYPHNEELYLTGLRLDQFHNPLVDPYPYYEQVLQRDSLDSRTNTQLGILYIQRGLYHEAEARLEAAVRRLTRNYTRPRDAEALYYLGVVRRFLGKEDAAYDAFYRAAWDMAQRSAAFFQLAEIDCRRSDWERALEHIDASLATNTQNTRALCLKAMILQKLRDFRRAEEILQSVSALDPLDPWAQWLLSPNPAKYAETHETETLLEVATWLESAGFRQEAISLLTALKDSGSPMVLYDLAYQLAAVGDSLQAKRILHQAVGSSHTYCFPFRLESIPALEYAAANLPTAQVYTALGNLYYDLQPQKAMECWRQAAQLDPNYALAWRNLGFGYAHSLHDYSQAATCYENAVAKNPNDARVLYELDVVYDQLNVPLEKRLKLFDKRSRIAFRRDDALARYIEVQLLAERYDEAIGVLSTHPFHVWEGGGEIHDLFVDAHLLRGLKRLKENRPQQALADFTAALDYPDNLQVGRPIHDAQSCRTWTLIGQAYTALHQEEKARRAFEKAAQLDVYGPLLYFKAFALERLGLSARAEQLYRALIENGEAQLRRESDLDFFAKFGEKTTPNKRSAAAHYLIALGKAGLGDIVGARSSLLTSAELDRNNLWVNHFLKEWNHQEKKQ
ncbi:MAG: hypothetical protein ONA69_09995, partial [candidate division KSB1 bacterium]|nr:hypothetical protein [candidate division KSB1 bacterium]